MPLTKRARPVELATCVVCDAQVDASKGAKCPSGHFTHSACLEMICQQAMQRAPGIVSAQEKAASRYFVCCMSTCGCSQPIEPRQLALGLTTECFAQLRDKDLELGLHMKLPDAVREHLAASAAATGSAACAKEQHEEALRAAYRQPDGSFKDERGEPVRQCERCRYGPIVGDTNCGNMRQHHGDAFEHNGMRYRRNQSCLNCGHLNSRHFTQWPVWDGRRVLGAEEPLVEPPFAAERVAPPPVADPPLGLRPPALVRSRRVMREDYPEGFFTVTGAYRDYLNGVYTAHGTSDGVPSYRRGSTQYTITRRDGRWWLDFNHGGSPYYCHFGADQPTPPVDGWDSEDCQSAQRVRDAGHPLQLRVTFTPALTPGASGDAPPAHGGGTLQVGDRVRVRRAVRRPRYQWGSLSRPGNDPHALVGTVTRILGTECRVNFGHGLAVNWMGLLSEMELVAAATDAPNDDDDHPADAPVPADYRESAAADPPLAPILPIPLSRSRGADPMMPIVADAPLAVGDRVRVRSGVVPRYGWGSRVDGSAVGEVRALDGLGGCHVDFPAHRGWHAMLNELERVSGAGVQLSAEMRARERGGRIARLFEQLVSEMGFEEEAALGALERAARHGSHDETAVGQLAVDMLVAAH